MQGKTLGALGLLLTFLHLQVPPAHAEDDHKIPPGAKIVEDPRKKPAAKSLAVEDYVAKFYDVRGAAEFKPKAFDEWAMNNPNELEDLKQLFKTRLKHVGKVDITASAESADKKTVVLKVTDPANGGAFLTETRVYYGRIIGGRTDGVVVTSKTPTTDPRLKK